MNIYNTYYMLAAVREMPVEHTFFKQRYFPTDTALDVFGTSRVLADYKQEGQKAAPFVVPRIGALPAEREGFSSYDLEPANISISMPLTLDQLKNRGFGESILSELTPEDRAKYFLMNDLSDLSARISRTEEILAVKTMIDNGCTMKHLTNVPGVYEDVGVKFYDGNNNPALFTPGAKWTHSVKTNGNWQIGNWYYDICTMIGMLTKNGRPAKEIIVAQDVADFLMEDGWVLEMLDNRRAEIGGINPSALTEYVYELCTLNFKGRRLPIIVCDGTYDNEGTDTPYVPDGTVIVTAPDCGKGLYGAVTQIEDDEEYHTIAGTRVPQHIVSKQPPIIETILTARPLFVPKRANPWTVAKSVL